MRRLLKPGRILGFSLLTLAVIFVLVCPAASGFVPGIGLCGENEAYQELSTTNQSGAEVLGLQTRLQELGLYKGEKHGILDAATQEAVESFKRTQGLSLDTAVDEDVWRALARTYDTTAAAEPAVRPEGVVSIKISVPARKLTVLVDGKPYRSYTVSVGKKSTPSPVGEWKIASKSINWGGGFGSRWMGLNVPWGIYGIHGTNKPWLMGQSVSHGCIRMVNKDAEQLYAMVDWGTEVTIEGSIPRKTKPPLLRKGQASQDVVLLQLLLRKATVFGGRADGRFGEVTEAALKYLEEAYQLPVDGVADPEVWKLLYKIEKLQLEKEKQEQKSTQNPQTPQSP